MPKQITTGGWVLAGLLAAAVSGCGGAGMQTEPLFLQGCPETGRAVAMPISDPGLRMEGPDAIGTAGDFLLMNERAAFIVQAPEHRNAYYLYGGIVVDAAPLDGCRQAAPERFQELGFLFGQLSLSDFEASVLRAFRGERAEVVADGSDGGPAVVRVSGSDDYFWIVELELIRSKVGGGGSKPLSQPFGADITVDYILEPGSPVLKVEMRFENRGARELSLLTASEIIFGTTATARYYSDQQLSVGGFGIDYGVPWITASANQGAGAWSFAMVGANLGTTNVGGVTALIDVNQALTTPFTLAPAGQQGSSGTVSFLLSVGDNDANSASVPLQPYNPVPIPRKGYTLVPVSGSVVRQTDGAAAAGVRVDLEGQNGRGSWQTLDSFLTGSDGSFAGMAPDFGVGSMPLRLVARAAGRPESEPVGFDPSAPGFVDLRLGEDGRLRHTISDGEGRPLPARIVLWRDGAEVGRFYGIGGTAEAQVAPGRYDVSVTRGYEYATWHGSLTVPAGGTATLDITLERLVDTTGFLSFDAHCHAAPSPDNVIAISDRIASVAAEGLEVVVSTDHEYIGSWESGVAETGLGGWVATVTGQEVTATVPEHTNMYPVEPDFRANARGGFVPWYGLDLEQIYAAERERGAVIRQLNHPKGYLDLIRFDPLTGTAGLADPTLLGLPAGSSLWSWDFEAIELMNGPDPLLRRAGETRRSGLFDDWMGFFNLGHRVTALGNSDAHDHSIPGTPRNYYVSSTDDPGAFSEEEFVDAVRHGRVVISTGAFATILANGAAGLGDTLTVSGGSVDIRLEVRAIPEIDVSSIRIFANCDQIVSLAATHPDDPIKYSGIVSVALATDATIVAAGFGSRRLPLGLPQFEPAGVPRFITNPIVIDADGNGVFDPPGGRECSYDR